VEASPDAVYSFSPDGHILSWNAGAERLFGYPANEALGQQVMSLLPEEEQEAFRQMLNDLRPGVIIEQVVDRLRKDGRTITVSVRHAPMIDAEGRIFGVSTVARDMGWEIEGARASADLAAIISTSADAIISTDARGRILSWNTAAEQLFGYTSKEILGQTTKILIPQHLMHIHGGAIDNLKLGRSRRRETVRQRKDGTCVDVAMTATPMFDAIGTYLGYSLILRDITDRKIAERRLREAEAFSRNVLESSGDAILVLGADGKVEFLNRSCCRLLGITMAATLIGVPWQSALPKNAHADFLQALGEARGQEVSRYTACYRSARGAPRWFDILVSPVHGEDGQPARFVVLARDTTEAKAQQEHISLIMRELCHRAKNLLAVISAMARNTAAQSATVSDFERAFSARIRSLAFSHDLLVQKDWVGVDLHQLVRMQLAPFCPSGSTRLEIEGPSVALKPEAGQMLGLALHELATNASKYGALSTTSGRLGICWAYKGANGDRSIELVWRETGGPKVIHSARSGFGRMVIEEMLAETLGGNAELKMLEEGVVWTASIPAMYCLPTAAPSPGMDQKIRVS